MKEHRGQDGEGSGWSKKLGWAVNCLHQMRAEIPSVNIAAAAATGGVVADAARDDHVWMVCQGDGGANSEPVLDNDIKVGACDCGHDERLVAALFCV